MHLRHVGSGFLVNIKGQGWSKEVLMGLDDKMAPFLAKANGIVATVGRRSGLISRMWRRSVQSQNSRRP